MGNNGLKLCHCGGTLFLDADRQGFIRVIDKLSEFIREDLNLKCLLVKSSRVASGAHHVASPSVHLKRKEASSKGLKGEWRRKEGGGDNSHRNVSSGSNLLPLLRTWW